MFNEIITLELVSQYIFIFSIIHGLIIAIALLTKIKKSLSNLFFSLWIIAAIFELIFALLLVLNKVTSIEYFKYINFSLIIRSVLFFHYARFLTTPSYRLSGKDSIEYIPGIIDLCMLIFFLFHHSAFEEIYYLYIGGIGSLTISFYYMIKTGILIIKNSGNFYNWMIVS